MPLKFSEMKKIENISETTMPMNTALNGIETDLTTSGIFQKSTHLKAGSSYKLPGEIGKFLGNLSHQDNSITLTGEMGSGKTRFALQLVNAYASVGKRCAVFSLEMSPDNYKVVEMKNQYIEPNNQYLVDWAGEAPNGVQDVEDATKNYDVIMIDSWQKLTMDPIDFDRLIKKYRNTAWVVLFQKNSKGTIRGGPSANYDAWVNLDTIKGKHFKENYVIATKNRYGDVGIKYNVFQQKIIQ